MYMWGKASTADAWCLATHCARPHVTHAEQREPRPGCHLQRPFAPKRKKSTEMALALHSHLCILAVGSVCLYTHSTGPPLYCNRTPSFCPKHDDAK